MAHAIREAFRRLGHSLKHRVRGVANHKSPTAATPGSHDAPEHATYFPASVGSVSPSSMPPFPAHRYTRAERNYRASNRYLQLRARLHLLEEHPDTGSKPAGCPRCRRVRRDEDELLCRIHVIEARKVARDLAENGIEVVDFAYVKADDAEQL